MQYTDHLAAFDREAAAFAATLEGSTDEVRVPSCPDWTLTDLAVHVGLFMAFWNAALRAGDPTARPTFEAPLGEDLAAWFDGYRADLHDAFATTDPGAPVWSWSDDPTARFAARRAAHELAIHRFDAELARGAPRPVDAALATDGIDEIDVMMRYRAERTGSGETIHLHATDVDDGEWLFVLGTDGFEMRHEHVKADVALRGAVSDLELVLYGRPPIGEVTQFGPDGVLATWRDLWVF